MFLQYFKLTEDPFGATPDPRFLFQSASHREALASLYTGFYGNRGFTVLIAEPGMGKTTLLFDFLDHIRDRAKTVFIFETLCEPRDLLSLIVQDLGMTPGETVAERHRQLNEFLAKEALADRKVVLVIDEAQNLSMESLEAVRLLTNFETSRSKLMQIVLVGQPQLADKLARPELSQLRQRVSTICRLIPFTAIETAAYIQHRLKLAGYTGGSLFTRDALQLVAEASHGIPRVINTLCFNSLCICRARNLTLVEKSTIAETLTDLQLPTPQLVSVNPPAPAEILTPIPVPVAEFAEVGTSSSRTARYVTAALLAICVGLGGVSWWVHRNGRHFSLSVPAILSHIRHASGVNNGRSIASPVQPVEAASAPAAAVELPTPPATTPSPSTGPKEVKVGPGDTLESIAIANLGSWDDNVLHQIQILNPNITDLNHIETGRTIRLPDRGVTEIPDVTQRSKP
jgi:type II secretory pathway predicted ATPase ExeA